MTRWFISYKNNLWLSSTIIDLDKDTGEVYRIPGQFPWWEKYVITRFIHHYWPKLKRK